jgi:hypothetical protein
VPARGQSSGAAGHKAAALAFGPAIRATASVRPRRGPKTRGDPPLPAPDEAEPAPADPSTVLLAAADIAEQRWERFGFDIYACLRAAWSDAGTGPAWVALTRPLHAQVPDGDLLGYNDCAAHRRAIAELLRRGARSLAGAAHDRPAKR